MEGNRDDKVEDMTSPPTMGSMQIAGSNGFAHSIEFMSQAAYLRNRYSEIDIEDENTLNLSKDQPLPIFLKFEDVEYKVRNSSQGGGSSSMNPVKAVVSKVASQLNLEQDNYKQILKGITGSIGPGEILALMGPSGSGKTTLLKIIGGRLTDNVKGKITVGFVTQDDVLLPQLTVEETLVFAAFLRLPGNMSRQQKYARVEIIMKDLGLERCRHTRIGGGFIKGISGGERKRTSIGHEILVDPSLLLLDEPTSGLDSTSANRLLQILQGLAKPSSRIFHTFDKILLISDGYPVYNGRARDSMDYFASLRFMPEIAMNPAEFMLDLATGQVNDISVPQYLQVMYKTQLEPKEKEENHRNKKAPEHLQIAVQFRIIYRRTFKERCRDYFDKLRLVQALGIAVLLGLLWWKSQTGTEAQLRDQVFSPQLKFLLDDQVRHKLVHSAFSSLIDGDGFCCCQIGLMFYICIFWTSSSIFGAVYVFPFEKIYIVKERKADMYPLSVYYVCSTLCDMVAHVFYPTFFTIIVYFMAGFKRTVPCFFLTLLAILLIAITSQGAGELFGAASLSIRRAGMFASLVLMLFLLTGGYYVQGGCRPLQSSPSFDTVNLKGGLQEVWVMLAMALGFRLLAYFCLRKRIGASHF
ncbi:ABC transporter G family member 26 [Linum perenne]